MPAPHRAHGAPRRASSARFPALALLAFASACGDADPTPPPRPPELAQPAAEVEDERQDPTGSPFLEPVEPLPDGPAEGVVRLGGTLDEVARERGLDYVNLSGEAGKPTVLEANGAGVAVLDLDVDGDLDLAFGQGVESLAALVAGPGADVELFRNDGSARFERAPAPGLAGWWTGLAAGDVTGDGAPDLVVAGYGDLALLVQTDGRLVRRASEALTPPPDERLVPGAPREQGRIPRWATSLALFDANRDGELDLYVGQYLELDPLDPPLGSLGEGALEFPCWWKGQEVYCGPRGLVPQPDRLLFGRGEGRFEDVSASALPEVPAGYTLAVAAFDADRDGDTDLYVANDSVANRLFVNDGSGRFSDFAVAAGVAVNQDGQAQAGMGVAVADVDRDGVADLAVTNFSNEPTELYLGAPVGFRTATHRYGLGKETLRLLSWGVHLVDFDADGSLELFTANGHVYPQADAEFTGTSYAQPDTLWTLGGGRAARVAIGGERPLTDLAAVSRGSAVADLDGDGRPDLVVVTLDGPAHLALNRLEPTAGVGHRLSLRLVGAGPGEDGERASSRDALGARVAVILTGAEGEVPLLGEVQTSGSYQSGGTPWLHFGLGRHERFEALEVAWPSGRVERLPGGPADRRLILVEGEGRLEEVER